MLNEITKLHDEMRQYVFLAGITAHTYDHLLCYMETASDTYKVSVLEFLRNLHSGPWAEFKKIRELPHITPEMWHNYSVMKIKGLPEQEKLKEAKNKIREAFRDWKKRNVKAKENQAKRDSNGTTTKPVQP